MLNSKTTKNYTSIILILASLVLSLFMFYIPTSYGQGPDEPLEDIINENISSSDTTDQFAEEQVPAEGETPDVDTTDTDTETTETTTDAGTETDTTDAVTETDTTDAVTETDTTDAVTETTTDAGTEPETNTGATETTTNAGTDTETTTDAGTDTETTTDAGTDTETTTDAGTETDTTETTTDAGTETDTTDAGTETDTTDAGTETDTTDAGTETDTTDAGTETDTTDAGTETDTTDAGTETDTTDAGTETDTTDAGTETDTTDAGTETTTETTTDAGTDTETNTSATETTTDAGTETTTDSGTDTGATDLEKLAAIDQEPTLCNSAEDLLKKDSSGIAVSNLQTILTKLGHDPKAIDGKFGPNTEKAVIQFQGKNGLVKDGKVGEKTWAKLCDLYNNPLVTSPSELNADSLKADDKYGGLIICRDCGKINMAGLSDKMLNIFPDINAIYIKHTGLPGEITSAKRSDGGKSLHDYGKAIDLRTKHLSNDVVKSIVKDLRSLFEKDYDIVDEHNKPISGVTTGPHIHIEYDPPKFKK